SRGDSLEMQGLNIFFSFTVDWYYHVPLKQPEKPVNSEIPLPPTSQIPGLSDLAEPHDEKMFGGRRKWIKDTDSEYVKLAKQGGRPDLLKHHIPATSKSSPVAYAAPDWYSHCSTSSTTDEPQNHVSTIPDFMIHKEFKASDHHSTNYETRRAPFDFDMKSVWQRDAEDKENTGKKKVKFPAINPKYQSKIQNVPTNKEFSGKNKLTFPPMPAQRNGEAVNFSKLISNGYGADWIQQHIEREKKVQQTSENSEELRGNFFCLTLLLRMNVCILKDSWSSLQILFLQVSIRRKHESKIQSDAVFKGKSATKQKDEPRFFSGPEIGHLI
uniref:Chromosome 7 open reading frame 57 n=1 Tax=Nothoprocta perdicaria TaxID=30464 RepID=A0A8C6ZLM8_NOTPE